MEKFRFLTAGESHGKGLTAIIEGIPSGFEINPDFINTELKRRQQGYGRGGRMKIITFPPWFPTTWSCREQRPRKC